MDAGFLRNVGSYKRRRNIPEDGILHNHSRENLKSYIELTGWALYWRSNVSFEVRIGSLIPEDGILYNYHCETLESYISPILCSRINLRNILSVYRIWGSHGGDYEECRLVGYRTSIRTSQGHISLGYWAQRLLLCKIWSFHGIRLSVCSEVRDGNMSMPTCAVINQAFNSFPKKWIWANERLLQLCAALSFAADVTCNSYKWINMAVYGCQIYHA
jgi:hypothetical protein